MIDVETAAKGLRLASSVIFILSYANTNNSASLKRGTILSFFSLVTGILASFPSEAIYVMPSLAIGLILGLILAYRIPIKSMPGCISLGFSVSSLFLAFTFVIAFEASQDLSLYSLIYFTIGAFLAVQSFAASVVAFGKLTQLIPSRQFFILGWFRHVINLLLLMGLVALAVLYYLEFYDKNVFVYSAVGVSALFGFHTNFAVGFCDVCLLLPLASSYLGFALSALGFIERDFFLVIAGGIVGNSGLVLGFSLAKVIFRNFISVMLASFSQSSPDPITYPSSKSNERVNNQELIKQVKISTNILIVPGYGVVKSGCQNKIVEFFNLLKGTGKNLSICLHPAAGRLPGQLNLLFEEAGLDPSFIKSVQETNLKMKETDLVITIGANDIINSGALDYSGSALASFPVIKIWESKSSVVFLRSPESLGFCKQNLSLNEKPKVKFMYGDANILLLNILREAKSRKHSLIRYNPSEKSVESADSVEFLEFPRAFMSIGVPKENLYKEKRVALTPNMVNKFRMLGFRVQVEQGAGKTADFFDEDYENSGAEIVGGDDVWDNDVILKIQKPNDDEIEMLSSASLLVSYIYPSKSQNFLEKLAKKQPKLTVLAMDLVPHSNRAQSVDSIKLMQTIEGYRAVIEAFRFFQRCPKPMITAAGKLPPAQVLIVGTDIAGISATSYCKNLGCITKAIDVKNIHAEDIAKLNAKLLLPRECEPDQLKQVFYETLKNAAKGADVVICSALVKDLGKILDDGIIGVMKPGSIIIDIYGNICTKVVKDQEVQRNGVTLLFYSDLVSRMAPQSSELYANCLYNIFQEIYDGEVLTLNELDDLVGSMFVIKEGKTLWYARPPMSPITAMVQTGKIAFRISIPKAEDNSPSIWSNLDFLWTTLVLLTFFIVISYFCLQYSDWSIIMEDLLEFVLALTIGSFICRNTEIRFYSNLVARAGAVCTVGLVTFYAHWEKLWGSGEVAIISACFVSFFVATCISFLLGVGLKICWRNQVMV